MKVDAKGIPGALKAHYDKIVAMAAIAALLASVVLLGVRAMVAKAQQTQFREFLERLQPMNPEVPAVEKVRFADAMAELGKPQKISLGENDNSLIVPESRVNCQKLICRKPIAFKATVCIFCNHEQDPIGGGGERDHDNDGMPDQWEEANGLDKLDPDDADMDHDSDGWTSLEEYKSGIELDAPSDPKDAKSTPPMWSYGKLRVTSAKSLQFDLIFKSAMKIAEGKYRFGINHVGGQTFWKKIGEEVLGFKVKSYEEKFVVQEDSSTGRKRVDVSRLTLQAGDKLVVLVKGEKRQQFEKSATLVFTPDEQTIEVGGDDKFEIRGHKYLVKTIDAERKTVVINDPTLGRSAIVGRDGEVE